MSVMLFSPVRLSAEMIPAVLDSHAQLESIAERVYVDDCEPEASALLREQLPEDATLLSIDGLERSNYNSAAHNWPQQNVLRIAAIRNTGIQHFLARAEADPTLTHLLIVDADLLLHPETVRALLEADKPVISTIFWSRWTKSSPWMPNVWDDHGYGFYGPESILRLAQAGVYQVGGLGACTLIRREVIEAGINYEPITGWNEWGEDRWFAMRCAVRGILLHVSTYYPAFHVYRPDMLEEGLAWRDQLGCSPAYFRDQWLTAEWEAAIRATPEKTGKKQTIIACCLPGDTYSSLWTAHWTTLFGALLRSGSVVLPLFSYSSNVYVTRGCLWDQLRQLEVRPDWVLWIDDDNWLTPGQLDSMIQTLEQRPEISVLAGWCWIAADGYGIEPIISCGHIDEDGHTIPMSQLELCAGDPVKEVGYTGFPTVLMRGALLDKLGPYPFVPLVGPQHSWGLSGDDVAFCVAAGAAGARVFVDRRVKVPHLKLQPAEPVQKENTWQQQSPINIR